MSVQNLKPCPKCAGQVAIWTYDDGWRRAECYSCDYIAKPGQNLVEAARNHNDRVAAIARTLPQPTAGGGNG